jgi:hypothetical protein
MSGMFAKYVEAEQQLKDGHAAITQKARKSEHGIIVEINNLIDKLADSRKQKYESIAEINSMIDDLANRRRAMIAAVREDERKAHEHLDAVARGEVKA